MIWKCPYYWLMVISGVASLGFLLLHVYDLTNILDGYWAGSHGPDLWLTFAQYCWILFHGFFFDGVWKDWKNAN